MRLLALGRGQDLARLSIFGNAISFLYSIRNNSRTEAGADRRAALPCCCQSLASERLPFMPTQQVDSCILGAWSSGMILLSGGRGPGFNSRSAPYIFAGKETTDSPTWCSDSVYKMRSYRRVLFKNRKTHCVLSNAPTCHADGHLKE